MSGFVSKSGDKEYIRQKNLHRKISENGNLRKQKSSPQVSIENKVNYIFSQVVIFYIGTLEQDILDQGNSLGFDLRKYEHQNIGVLLHGCAIIVSNPDMDLLSRIETLNFAKCYGIPLIWISKKTIPYRYASYFKLMVTGDINAKEFWREVWDLNL